MGKRDNRKTQKMRRRKSWKRMKARIKARIAAGSAASSGSKKTK